MNRVVTIRVGGFSARARVRVIVVCGALLALCAVLGTWAMTLGTYTVALADIGEVIVGSADSAIAKVVGEWRAPRVVAAVLFGAALGCAGGIFQSLTRNPLGSPDVIGLTTGSFTGVVAVMLFGATSYGAFAGGALVGGLGTALVVYLLSFHRGVQGFRFIIVGIAVGAFLQALNTWFMVKVDVDLALRAAIWGAGSLSIVDWDTLAIATPVLVVVAVFLPLAQQRLRRLELGDDTAAMLGIRVERAKALLILLAIAGVATVTAAAGPIAFVALAAPQIARRITGRSAATELASAALVGSVLLLAADIVAQHAIPGIALPTGAVTVCLGGAYLLALLVREGRRAALV